MSAYVTSKHAVIGLMRSAARECAGQNIRVNTVNPSPVETRMMRSIEEGIAPGGGEQVNRGSRVGSSLEGTSWSRAAAQELDRGNHPDSIGFNVV